MNTKKMTKTIKATLTEIKNAFTMVAITVGTIVQIAVHFVWEFEFMPLENMVEEIRINVAHVRGN